MNQTSQNLIVTLVHGTWGRRIFPRADHRAQWCEQESAFSKRLVAALDGFSNVEVRAFNWSGSNSIAEREQAARDLTSNLELIPKASLSLVIAHSHGGNVALKAITDMEDASEISLATLATPFLTVSTKSTLTDGQRSKRKLGWNITLIGIAGIIAGENQNIANFVKSAFSWGLSGYALLLTTIVVALFLCWSTGSLMNAFINGAGKSSANDLAKATRFNIKNLPTRLLVVRGTDDEAALSLAAAAISTRLAFLTSSLSIWVGIAFGVPVAMGIGFFLYGNFLEAVEFGRHVNGYLIVVAVLASLMPGLFRAMFGRELLFGTTQYDVSVESTPDSTNAHIVTLFPGTSSDVHLRHSLYNHPDVTTTIADWFKSHQG